MVVKVAALYEMVSMKEKKNQKVVKTGVKWGKLRDQEGMSVNNSKTVSQGSLFYKREWRLKQSTQPVWLRRLIELVYMPFNLYFDGVQTYCERDHTQMTTQIATRGHKLKTSTSFLLVILKR
ncbi:hypothetical protein DVH24_001473 [Malus domestica]|uniref:Uncharacterized protein n=1 Tax=Malus domestica TaxID=3750 RepID=A0A498JZA5_MALDO|nr:hypothetical protein DVH24_001473 [Malus domestica]